MNSRDEEYQIIANLLLSRGCRAVDSLVIMVSTLHSDVSHYDIIDFYLSDYDKENVSGFFEWYLNR